MKILLIGPQGSGKSTQAKLLAQYLNVPHISTGDIFREKISEDTEEGRRIKQLVDTGQLVDDKTTVEIVRNRIQQIDCRDGFVMDGFPRTPNQVQALQSVSSSNEPHFFNKVFFLDIPDEVIIKRLMKRGRKDDTPEIIKTRLENYKNNTANLIEYFKGANILVSIDGEGSVEKIQDEIREQFKRS